MSSLWILYRTAILIPAILIAAMAWPGQPEAANLKLTWVDNASNEDGFKIERSSGSGFAKIAVVGANVESYKDDGDTDFGLTDGTTYCYQVRAFNSDGVSDPSNQACANATDSGTGDVPIDDGGDGPGDGGDGSDGSGSDSTSTSQIGSKWTDYRMTVKIKSKDNDSIGVMFRYVDNTNYYRFSWDRQNKTRRLGKLENGVFTVLADDAVPYVTWQTYQLEIVAEGTMLEVRIDGALIFSVTDTSFSEGSIALYSFYNAGSIFDDVLVEDLFTGSVLLWDDFNDGDFTGWTMIDEGTKLGPSKWSASSGALVQSSNIGFSTTGIGTFALYGIGQGTETAAWTDYRMTVKIRSKDNDSIGVMFRYLDNENYYRFSWKRQGRSRRLEKRENGVFTVLAKDGVPYVTWQTYQLEIVAEGTTLEVRIDGALIFSVTDASFFEGSIALYSFYNAGSIFDDVLVEDLFTGSVLLWDDFNDGDFTGWTMIDDEGTRLGPSKWSASSGALVQSSNIGSSTSGNLGTFALY